MVKYKMGKKEWEQCKRLEREWWQRWKERSDMGQVRDDLTGRADKIRSIILSHFPSAEELSILQIGPAANGEIHFLPGKRHAIDPLAPFFKQNFAELMDPKVNFIEGMGEELPYKDSYFNVILIINVLDHCSDPDRVLQEIHRCLCNGGILILEVNTYGEFASHVHQTFRFIDREHPFALTIRYIKSRLSQKYEIINETFSSISPPGYDIYKRTVLFISRIIKIAPVDYKLIARKIK